MKKNNIKMFVMILGVSFLPVSTVQAGELNPDFFRTISGNPRQFNYRDESAGLCVSAQKYNNKNLFLISPDSCIGFRKKASRICVENQEHFVL